MGLFSKLLGDVAPDLDLDKLVKTVTDVAKEVAEDVKEAAKEVKASVPESDPSAAQAPARQPAAYGNSWGEFMPDEENQYNYPGTYLEYFDHIFRDDFPEYETVREPGRSSRSYVYTLRSGGLDLIKIELLHDSSSAYKLRRDCAAIGLPYLRFYYDHDGWWNTRTYVRERVRNTIGR